MSLNFSIDSILRHGNVESADSTLLTGLGKLGQTSFLDESTSAFLKKQQQLNYLNSGSVTSNGGLSSAPSITNGLTANSSNPLIGDTAGNSLLQSQLLYLNKTAAGPMALMSDGPPNGCSIGGPSSLFGFELSQLSHLNPLELSRLNQLSQLNQLNQLNQFRYLTKINTLYGEPGGGSPNAATASTHRPSTGGGSSDEATHPNSNSHSFNHFNHQLNNHLHSATENSSTAAAFLNLANGTAGLLTGGAQSVGSFNTSQCSPLSDKSSEMLLNYEDSSDSNRLSQHSGNNMSINSNNSTNQPKQSSANNLSASKNGAKSKDKDFPLCTKCKLHGIHSLVKGHKKSCPKKDCMCELCILTDYGKRLRGKKSKKAAGILPETTAGPAALTAGSTTGNPLTPANLFMMDSLNHLSESSLLTTGGLQSTTPNSNSNSSCSSLSNAALAAAAASTLRNNSLHPAAPSVASSAALSSAMQQQLASLGHPAAHQQLAAFGGFLDGQSALKDYKRIVIHLLKEKLAQDGLNYEQELGKLKITVIYLLLSRFDKSELYKKLAELTNS